MPEEDEFEDLAADCINEAENVNCTFAEFIDGLRIIHEAIKERLEQALAEQADFK